MKFCLIFLFALIAYGTARTVQVVEMAAQYAPVGMLGPALINLPPYLAFSSGHGITIGPPNGTTLIGLSQRFHAAYGLVPPPISIPTDHGHSGQYMAATRGSVHVAPLIGHKQSVRSTNLEPAPGTLW